MIQCKCGSKDVETGVINGTREIVCRSCGAHTENLQDYYNNFSKIKEDKEDMGVKCKNHPEKRSWKAGLCYACYFDEHPEERTHEKKPQSKPPWIGKEQEKEVCSRLRQARKERGLECADIAKIADMPKGTVQSAECAVHMSEATLKKITEAIGARWEWVLNGTGLMFVEDKLPPKKCDLCGEIIVSPMDHGLGECVPITSRDQPTESGAKEMRQAVQAVKSCEIYHLANGDLWADLSFKINGKGLQFDTVVWPEGFETDEVHRLTVDNMAFLGLVAAEIRRIEGVTC